MKINKAEAKNHRRAKEGVEKSISSQIRKNKVKVDSILPHRIYHDHNTLINELVFKGKASSILPTFLSS